MIKFSNYAWFLFFEIGTRRKLTLINPKGQNTQYDMSLQQIVVKNLPLCTVWATSSAPSHSNKSLCVYLRISAKNFCLWNRILLPQNVAQIQSDWFCATWCYGKILLWRQKFLQKFFSTHKVICRCNLLPWLVAATCWRVCSIPKVFKCCFWKTFPLNTNFPAKHWEWQYYMYM